MQFDYCSDLHLDFDGPSSRVFNHFPEHRSPFLILAGDIAEVSLLTGPSTAMAQQVHRFFDWVNGAYEKVLFLMGNHEYYGGTLNGDVQLLRDSFAQRGLNNIVVLENDTIEIDDVVLFGCTLWTSCRNRNPVVMNAVQNAMADYKQIGYLNEHGERIRITAEFTVDLHDASMRALKDFLQLPTDKTRVVLTHHAPHIHSIEPCYRKHSATDGFYEELFDLIDGSDIKVWVHGHTHYGSDYMLGNTRILANPRGYYGSENTSIFRVKSFSV